MVVGLVRGLSYKVVCAGLLGGRVADWVVSHGWAAVGVVSGLAVALLTAFFLAVTPRAALHGSFFAYCGISTTVLLVVRPQFLLAFAGPAAVLPHGRYFFIATVMLLCFAYLLGYRYLLATNSSPVKRGLVCGIFAAWLFLQASQPSMRWTGEDLQWATHARQIEAAQRQADIEGRTNFLHVPINPRPWTIDLEIAPRNPGTRRPVQ